MKMYICNRIIAFRKFAWILLYLWRTDLRYTPSLSLRSSSVSNQRRRQRPAIFPKTLVSLSCPGIREHLVGVSTCFGSVWVRGRCFREHVKTLEQSLVSSRTSVTYILTWSGHEWRSKFWYFRWSGESPDLVVLDRRARVSLGRGAFWEELRL